MGGRDMVATLKDAESMRAEDLGQEKTPTHVGEQNTEQAKKVLRKYRLPQGSPESDAEFGPEVEGINTIGFGAKGR